MVFFVNDDKPILYSTTTVVFQLFPQRLGVFREKSVTASHLVRRIMKLREAPASWIVFLYTH